MSSMTKHNADNAAQGNTLMTEVNPEEVIPLNDKDFEDSWSKSFDLGMVVSIGLGIPMNLNNEIVSKTG